jgi:putative FmdB family regulatory protein
MPDYEHECQNPDCRHFWEDTYSIKQDPPKVCPKCNQETAKRLISLGGRGVVELNGQELIDRVKSDVASMKKDMAKSDKVYANLLGEDKYHKIQTQLDQRKRK